jgi:hypothetical protein
VALGPISFWSNCRHRGNNAHAPGCGLDVVRKVSDGGRVLSVEPLLGGAQIGTSLGDVAYLNGGEYCATPAPAIVLTRKVYTASTRDRNEGQSRSGNNALTEQKFP